LFVPGILSQQQKLIQKGWEEGEGREETEIRKGGRQMIKIAWVLNFSRTDILS
jgi:hypothetical protein